MQDIVIFDLDNTLALTRHRERHLFSNPPDLTTYYAECIDDPLIHSVAAIFFDHMTSSRDIWIVSKRSDEVLNQTARWLHEHGLYYGRLLLKPSDDIRSNADIKMRWLHDGTIPRNRVLCAYDADQTVIDMYRAEGITCFHTLAQECRCGVP